jgi:hypothetical protein
LCWRARHGRQAATEKCSREQRQKNTLRIEPVNNNADADPAILQAMLGNRKKQPSQRWVQVDNVSTTGATRALTGPIGRGTAALGTQSVKSVFGPPGQPPQWTLPIRALTRSLGERVTDPCLSAAAQAAKRPVTAACKSRRRRRTVCAVPPRPTICDMAKALKALAIYPPPLIGTTT